MVHLIVILEFYTMEIQSDQHAKFYHISHGSIYVYAYEKDCTDHFVLNVALLYLYLLFILYSHHHNEAEFYS